MPGVGPGHGVDFLIGRGLSAFGVDLSSGLIEQARAGFPEIDVRVGDITSLEIDDGSLGGLFARYSVIHFPPNELPTVFAEWARVLRAGAPIVVMFFASRTPEAHGTPFDHKVTAAYELDPATVGELLTGAGFDHVQTGAAPPPPAGRPFDKGFVAARRTAG